MPDIRMPTQKRSIEKRNRIIQKGFELMCEEGYHNTNTTQIAEYAGVSTGIIYQYFKDKKDIFLEGVKHYSEQIMYPMISVLETEKFDVDHIPALLEQMIQKFLTAHTISKKAHEELMAMSHLDEDVSNIFKDYELKTTETIVALLENNQILVPHLTEKVHIIVGMVDNFCHEVVYHKHKKIHYDIMKEEVIKTIIEILK